jgi:hypothetical protein
MLDCDRTLQHVNSTLQKIPKEKKFKKDTIILSITSAVRITEVITIISTLKKKQQYQSIWFFNIKLFFSLSPKDVSNKRFVHEKYRCIDLSKYDI